DALDLAALGPGLFGDEDMAEHRRRRGLHLGGRLGEAHAALAALGARLVLELAGAAAAGMDLGLHDIDRPGQRAGDFLGFLGGVGDPALGHRNTESREQGLGLIFVDIHRSGPAYFRAITAGCRRRIFAVLLRPWAAATAHRPRPVLRCGKGETRFRSYPRLKTRSRASNIS